MDVTGNLITSDDNTSMLNRAVRVEESSTHHAGGWVAFQFVGQCFYPTGMNFRVVVQEDHYITSSQQGPLVACFRKSQILFVSPDPDVALNLCEKLLSFVTARIVYYQDLIEPIT